MRRLLTVMGCLLITSALMARAELARPVGPIDYQMRITIEGRQRILPVKIFQRGDEVYLRAEDLLGLGIRLPAHGARLRAGEAYIALSELEPRPLLIDHVQRRLWLEPPPVAATAPAPADVGAKAEVEVEEAALQDNWVEINVNQSREPLLARALMTSANHFYINEATLDHFRLKKPAESQLRDGERYYPVAAIPGALSAFDEREQSLALSVGSEAFRASQQVLDAFEPIQADFSQRGALFNYGLFGSSSDQADSVSGQFEFGAFWGRGFLSSQHLSRDIGGENSDSVRLDSSLRLDWPETMTTLRLGDSINEAGAWGRSVRFGGVQWGRNFATQPGFITFPTELVVGETAVPSTVDIFINGARRSSQPVEPGPFTLREVPVVTGAGEMRIVTRDLLGRETVVTRSFYASAQLLRPGLHEYSYEAGALRENFSRRSSDYGDSFASATHRYGFNRRFTGELRAEGSRDIAAVGVGANWLWPAVGEFNFSLAASRDAEQQRGEQVSLGLRRQARGVSFGAAASWRSAEWRQLGDGGRVPDALESRAFVSVGLGRAGSLALSHVRRNPRLEPDIEFATLQYSLGLWQSAQLRLSYFEPLSDELERSAAVTLSVPLGRSRSAQLSTSRQGDETVTRAQVQRNLPAGRGWGYRASAEQGVSDNYEAGVSLRGDAGQANLQVGQTGELRETRASLDGGVAWMGGWPFLSQRLDQGFAVVEVPGMADVGIYRDNQLFTTTNRAGKALVPNLRDYQRNLIRIDDAGLPMDVQVDSLEQQVIPAHRHGVRLRFEIARTQWVGFQVLDRGGEPLAIGTPVLDESTGQRHVVGDRGRVYIEADSGRRSFRAWPGGQPCVFQVSIPSGNKILPDLGEQQCQ